MIMFYRWPLLSLTLGLLRLHVPVIYRTHTAIMHHFASEPQLEVRSVQVISWNAMLAHQIT